MKYNETLQNENDQENQSSYSRSIDVPGALRNRRRSSLAQQIGSLTSIGGVNSLDRFASSFTRAQGFYNIDPTVRQKYSYESALYESYDGDSSVEQSPKLSLITATEDARDESDLVARNSSAVTDAQKSYISEVAPLLTKQVAQDNHLVMAIVGQSTLPQTIFNSINILVGIGLLSLPLAIGYSGWVIGLSFLVVASITTFWTARILAKVWVYTCGIC